MKITMYLHQKVLISIEDHHRTINVVQDGADTIVKNQMCKKRSICWENGSHQGCQAYFGGHVHCAHFKAAE